ncbi:MAG: CvpA family protein [Acidobacteria bacterium]|nr:MAG: CvpA family protein [Acidobacteriota bacterium]
MRSRRRARGADDDDAENDRSRRGPSVAGDARLGGDQRAGAGRARPRPGDVPGDHLVPRSALGRGCDRRGGQLGSVRRRAVRGGARREAGDGQALLRRPGDDRSDIGGGGQGPYAGSAPPRARGRSRAVDRAVREGGGSARLQPGAVGRHDGAEWPSRASGGGARDRFRTRHAARDREGPAEVLVGRCGQPIRDPGIRSGAAGRHGSRADRRADRSLLAGGVRAGGAAVQGSGRCGARILPRRSAAGPLPGHRPGGRPPAAGVRRREGRRPGSRDPQPEPLLVRVRCAGRALPSRAGAQRRSRRRPGGSALRHLPGQGARGLSDAAAGQDHRRAEAGGHAPHRAGAPGHGPGRPADLPVHHDTSGQHLHAQDVKPAPRRQTARRPGRGRGGDRAFLSPVRLRGRSARDGLRRCYPLGAVSLNPVDITFGVILAAVTIGGVLRGFVRIAVGLAGLGISLALALRLADRGPLWFSGLFATPEVARVAAFVLVLAGGLFATVALAWIARRLIAAAEVGWLDRLAGAVVGLVGGALLCAGLLVALTAFLPPGSPALRRSRLVPITIVVTDLAARVLPPGLADTYRRHRRALDPWLGGKRPETGRSASW